MALIELKGVSRHYQHGDVVVRALDGISLSIGAGEMVAIVGASGSGKSTLMNVLGCLDKPTGGEFHVAGQDISSCTPDALAKLRRERFGFIFQRYHLLPHLDATGNVEVPAIYAHVDRGSRRERARALLARLGLSDRISHRPNAMSGGQQQRVSIARALMNGGEIILADEPTGALDSRSGAELLKLLEELNARGHTVIIVTHDMGVAAHARRLIEMSDGRVLRDSGAGEPAASTAVEQDSSPRYAAAPWWRRWPLQWREALHMALAALLGNRLRSALSMLGISIGIAAVVSIVALTTAARDSVDAQMRGFMSGRLMVFQGNPDLSPGEDGKPFSETDMTAVRALRGIDGIQATREMQVSARQGSRQSGISVQGSDKSTLVANSLQITQGRNLSELDLAQRAQVLVLDPKARTALFKPGEAAVGRTVLLNDLPFTVIGVAEQVAGPLTFSNWIGQVFVPVSTFNAKMDTRAQVSRFSAHLDLSLPPSQVKALLTYRLKALHGREDFNIWSAEDEYRKFQQVTGMLALILTGIGGISLLVGGVGVMNIMLVSVSERTREIGIRMAVGARQSDVRLQFLIESVVLCCLGGLAGVALCWLGAAGLNATTETFKVHVSWLSLVVAFGVSSAVGLIFGTMPAQRAAALSPVDALARE